MGGGGGGGCWRNRPRWGCQTTGRFHWMRGERRPHALPASAASGMLACQPRRAAGASGCQMLVCPARSAYRAGPRRNRPCNWPCLKASHTADIAPYTLTSPTVSHLTWPDMVVHCKKPGKARLRPPSPPLPYTHQAHGGWAIRGRHRDRTAGARLLAGKHAHGP
jgi:hypothetical protein